MDDKQAFEIVETRAELKNPLPSGLSVRRNGFSRQQVVDALATTFEMIGGVTRMTLWANANPDKFYALYSKLLPSTSIQIGDGATVVIEHAIPRTDLDSHPDPDADPPATGG